jgi:hypothetical protein
MCRLADRSLITDGLITDALLQISTGGFNMQKVALPAPRIGPSIWIRVCDFMTSGTISLPTHYRLANAPSVIQRPCHLAWEGLGPVSGGVVFSKLSKLLNQENALSAPF